MPHYVHVYAGHFGSEEKACLYAREQWEPEPAPSVSDTEYSAWENRNPSWAMRDELQVAYLDSDFIETICGRRDGAPGLDWPYLESMLSDEDAGRCRAIAPPEADTFILIFHEALGGFDAALKPPASVSYCGRYTHTAFASRASHG